MKITIQVDEESAELTEWDMKHIGERIADGYEQGIHDPKPGINWWAE